MPSPFKHPTTGVYWYRQRVPVALKASARGMVVTVTVDGFLSKPTIGDDIKVSLRTKLPAEAKRRATEAQAEFDRVWLSFSDGPVSLTQKQIVALAGEMFHAIRAVLEDNPGEAGQWAARRRERESGPAVVPTSELAARLMIKPPDSLRKRLGSWVDGALSQHHLRVDERTYERLLVEFDRAVGDIAALLERRANGDYTPDPVVQRFPHFEANVTVPVLGGGSGASLTDLVEVWSNRMKRPRPQTIKSYSSVIRLFTDYIGHDESSRVTDMDIVRWHDDLTVAKTVTHDTFIKKHRAAISTVYAYAMTPQGRKALADRGRPQVSQNPAARLPLEGERKVVTRSLAFSTEEAHKILGAASNALAAENGYAEFNRLAMRWVPWVCAYTGARAGEVSQLRRCDFVEIDGVKCIALLPDAGTIKGGLFRHVPLHPDLLAQGLWSFAMSAKEGPLFFNPASKSEAPWLQTVKLLGAWVRETAKVTDTRLSPNHAWRHWFKTKGRTAGVADAYLDVICGHSLPTQGGKYGDYEPPALFREIKKLPVITLKPLDDERQ